MMPSGPVLGDAILRLQPTAKFVLRNEDLETLEWVDDAVERPSDELINQTLQLLIAEFGSSEYARLRKDAYPPIGDQLDDLFKAGLFSDEMSARIAAVKQMYPKD